MKKIKLQCECGAGETLEIGDFGDGQVYISLTPYKQHKTIFEVIIDKKKLVALVNEE